VLFATLAATSADVAATRSRLAKRALIAAAIRQAVPAIPTDQVDTAEVALVVTYLSGSLRQRRTGVGWASLSSLPAPAPQAELTVTEAYSGKSLTVAIRGGGFTPVVIQTDAGKGWYDITVTAHHDSPYLRRLAGHVETGAPSISDPALGAQ